MAQVPDAFSPESPLWGPPGMYHYWAEPLYGYYFSADPWSAHAQLLSAAGIDVLIFDTTNAVTYPEVYSRLCLVFEDVRNSGGRTPQIAFMVNTQAGATANRIYQDLSARAAPGPLVHLGGEAAPDLRSPRGQPRAPAILHAPPGALAVHHGEYAPCLALGGDLSPGVRLQRTTRRRPSRSTSRWRRTSASTTGG